MIDAQTARERMLAASDEWQRRHRMTEWNQAEESPRVKAVKGLLTSLEQNDAQYLDGAIDREKYAETAREIDNRLAVAGLRLAARPWERK